jgi:intermediate peptidase
LNHLVGYGATYYSYLYAQCLSASLWERALEGAPCGREAGTLLRRRLLEPGGALEAAQFVQQLFGGAGGTQDVLVRAEGGGHFPDPGGLLRQLGLAQ